MKCPKCGYLGFEAVDRCRNCGYDFSLTSSAPLADLALRPAPPADGPLDDLTLIAPEPRQTADALRTPGARAERRQASAPDLPLFGGEVDDTPLIARPSPPRQPLAVRRSTPEVPRLRPEPRPTLLDQAEDPPMLWRPPAPAAMRASPSSSAVETAAPEMPDVSPATAAGLVARVLAGVIDLSVLLIVDAIVVYFTLKICGLTFAEFDLLPKIPLVTYLVMQNLGYVAAFTVGGQTLGKMVTGVQIVVEGTNRPPALAQALLRTCLWAVLALPVGLGLVSVLLDAEKRGLHDRFSRTRVVRVAS